jgi:predicted Rossmann fold flavoprotein
LKHFDVIIIGAGGAGMMCGSVAGKLGRSVLLIDHNQKIGRKILISGGGRCNFTNTGTRPESFVSNNPHFAKSALSRFTPADFIKLVEKHRIRYHEKKLGQLFCDHSAEQIVDMLIDECNQGGCIFQTDTAIKSVNKETKIFKVDTTAGLFTCDSLVIATGGLSIPQIGATGFGYEVAKQFGLKIIQTAAALDGFSWGDSDLARFSDLAGLSLDTAVSCKKASFRENILFTHNGLSGPASLQISLYWSPGDSLSIDLMPEGNALEILQARKKAGSRQEIKNVLGELLPKRFAEYFTHYLDINGPMNTLPDKKLIQLAGSLNGWQVAPARTVGYKKAEVTRGGVDTSELSSKTMEAKKVPGLYFIGEVVDVTGMLGGYNFQWAWASGFAAGQAV